MVQMTSSLVQRLVISSYRPDQIMGKLIIICFIIFLMISYENHQHNLQIIIDMTGKSHRPITAKHGNSKSLQNITIFVV